MFFFFEPLSSYGMLQNMMDVQIMIEYCELVIALIYVARSGQKESHWTVITFFGMIGALSVDIFILSLVYAAKLLILICKSWFFLKLLFKV